MLFTKQKVQVFYTKFNSSNLSLLLICQAGHLGFIYIFFQNNTIVLQSTQNL